MLYRVYRRVEREVRAVAEVPQPVADGVDIQSRYTDHRGVAHAGGVTTEVGDRDGVDDHLCGVTHPHRAGAAGVGAFNGILPGSGERAETQRGARACQHNARAYPVVEQLIGHPRLRGRQADHHAGVAGTVIAPVGGGDSEPLRQLMDDDIRRAVDGVVGNGTESIRCRRDPVVGGEQR